MCASSVTAGAPRVEVGVGLAGVQLAADRRVRPLERDALADVHPRPVLWGGVGEADLFAGSAEEPDGDRAAGAALRPYANVGAEVVALGCRHLDVGVDARARPAVVVGRAVAVALVGTTRVDLEVGTTPRPPASAAGLEATVVGVGP